MKNGMSNRVQMYLDGKNIKDSLESILHELIEDGSDNSLGLVLQMAKDDYGGITYKAEYQTITCLYAIFWGRKGIQGLVNTVIDEPDFRSISNFTLLLGYLAANKFESYPFLRTNIKSIDIDRLLKIATDNKVIISAREGLIDIMRKMTHEDIFPIGLIQNLSFGMMDNKSVQEILFAAMMTRWFHFDKQGVENYLKLINQTHEEQAYHSFLETNNFLLDPFSIKIWSKPKFGEVFVPDFLIRSMDNSYTIVEIEKPSLPIITKNGNISSVATHAKRQILDYRDWAISNHLYAEVEYPEIWRPNGLVIIGMEEKLTKKQKEQLRKENESTQGIVKVVGFDWLYNRTKSIFSNLIQFGFGKKEY